MRLIFAAACVALCGCVSTEHMSTETRMEEIAWQSVHLADAMQTYEIARDDCYREVDPIAAAVIGDRPSKTSVIAWGVGTAYLHAAGTTFLSKFNKPWLTRAWQFITIGAVANAVYDNHTLGIRIGGGHKYSTQNRCYQGR